MGYPLKRPILAGDLARALGLQYVGKDIAIATVVALSDAIPGGLTFSKGALERYNCLDDVIYIGQLADGEVPQHFGVIVSERPRLAFARAVDRLRLDGRLVNEFSPPTVHPTAIISPGVHLGSGVVVGERTVIFENVVVADGVKIGKNCVIKSNTVIGQDGFGFERDEVGIPVRFPHLGSVVIDDNVEIGALNTICRGALGDTRLESFVKTDDHVHIAHNCLIRSGALITACVEISGGVEVGAEAWIGPNSSIIQKVSIGDGAFIGIGSNVTKSVGPGMIVAGNPARALRKS